MRSKIKLLGVSGLSMALMAGSLCGASAQSPAFKNLVADSVKQACAAQNTSQVQTIASTLLLSAQQSSANAAFVASAIGGSCPSLQTAYNQAGSNVQLTSADSKSVTPSTKGNNGVGNGIDPQPPGNPPINDGPGTGPGNPGNKGGPT
jgi:hypothetical protein